MTLVAEKTWEMTQVTVWGDVGGADTENRHLLFGIKQALISGTVPWVVKSSCDAVTVPTAPLVIDDVTLTNPCVVRTTTNHNQVTGDRIRIENVVGTTELNDLTYTVTLVDATHVSLDGIDATTGYTAYGSGGDFYFQDNIDKWTMWSDLTWNYSGSNHSWIVMEAPGMNGGTFQVLINCNNRSDYTESCTIYVSASGMFFGGSLTARPTAPDEVLVVNGNWGCYSDGQSSKTAMVCKTSDGECTRVYLSYARTSYGCWMFETPKNPIANWTNPWMVMFNPQAVAPTTARMFTDWAFHVQGSSVDPTEAGTARATGLIVITDQVSHSTVTVDGREYDDNYLATPLGLDYNSSSDNRRLGTFYDFWAVSTSFQDWQYLEGSGGPWKMIKVGGGFAQPGDGTPWGRW